ncbi:MAG TPA: methyltransferase domain-containing protein [Anaerolineales bacterium]
MIDNKSIAAAFSRTAEKYDRFAEDHPNLTRMRTKVYSHLKRFLAPEAHILELNAGTGTDAVYLAQQGYHVHATDIAPDMLQRIHDKVDRLNLGDKVSIQNCSFTDLGQVHSGPFDAVFSNLGGLNCSPDLNEVTKSLSPLLKPGGVVTWVLMPPICLSELALALGGNLKVAFRRLSPQGTLAHLEGLHFMIYYYTPDQVIDAFGQRFIPLSIEGLSVFAPPAESKNLARRHPSLYRWLCWLDDHLAHRSPFFGWGDFFIISLRYEP